MQRKIYLFL